MFSFKNERSRLTKLLESLIGRDSDPNSRIVDLVFTDRREARPIEDFHEHDLFNWTVENWVKNEDTSSKAKNFVTFNASNVERSPLKQQMGSKVFFKSLWNKMKDNLDNLKVNPRKYEALASFNMQVLRHVTRYKQDKNHDIKLQVHDKISSIRSLAFDLKAKS